MKRGERTVVSYHLMECSYSVSTAKLGHIGANAVNIARDVVAGVGAVEVGHESWDLPVFGVGAGDDDFDEDLVCLWRGYRCIGELASDAMGLVFVDLDFFHDGRGR